MAMIKTLITVFTALAISACAFPSRFDNQEHARIVNIYVTSSDNTMCGQPDQARLRAEQMYRDAVWALSYGTTLPNNAPMTVMEKNLVEITKELYDRYQKTEPVSAFYCRSKFDNIHRASETIIKVSARRPRS
jgi:hypothetical protein